MAKKSYKLSNESKLNNKSDSVVLTNYKKLEDNFFVEEKNQEIKSEGYFGSIDYTLSKKDEMIKKLENLKQFREQLEKYLLEIYTELMPLQEDEKEKFEELIKEFEQFRVQLEDGQKYLLEMYTELTIISEAEKKELEKVNNLANSSNSSRLGYENLDLIGLKENWEKLNEKFEQFRREFEYGTEYISGMDIEDYKKLEDGLLAEEQNQENENQYSNCFSVLRRKLKFLNLIITSFREKFQRVTTKNSKLSEEITFLNKEIETLISKQKELDQNIEKIMMIIEQQRKERNIYETKIVAIKSKNDLKQPKFELDSLNEKESEEEMISLL